MMTQSKFGPDVFGQSQDPARAVALALLAAGCVSVRFNIVSLLGNTWNEDAFVRGTERAAKRGMSVSLHATVDELKARWSLIARARGSQAPSVTRPKPAA